MAKNRAVRAATAQWRTAMVTKRLNPGTDGSPRRPVWQTADYQTEFAAQGIPPGAMEKITARKVYPVMAPADYQGRSAGAPVKGPRGSSSPSPMRAGTARPPPPPQHGGELQCLSGRFEIAWGDAANYVCSSRSHDFGAARREPQLPQRRQGDGRTGRDRGERRRAGRSDLVRSELQAKEIENEYGKGALEGLQKVGFKFEDEPTAS